jgi:hypothetical protein
VTNNPQLEARTSRWIGIEANHFLTPWVHASRSQVLLVGAD